MMTMITTLFELLAPLFLLASTIVCVVMGRGAGKRMEEYTDAERYFDATRARLSRRTAYRIAAVLAACLLVTMIVKLFAWLG
ncbi:hypothetical protein B8X04_17080 [Brevibacterium casei]|uniref:Uncharacterized protein n=1 Tax=Brevibacterium casei TaxID=33889 RepID=A0A269Z463_9MICO|nr:hypothetical protein [Brevibacterium casei]PAK92578.1 hypothetical protein B8X04_17080 [Brevibacterium casei]